MFHQRCREVLKFFKASQKVSTAPRKANKEMNLGGRHGFSPLYSNYDFYEECIFIYSLFICPYIDFTGWQGWEKRKKSLIHYFIYLFLQTFRFLTIKHYIWLLKNGQFEKETKVKIFRNRKGFLDRRIEWLLL